jgi:hypothetical protein
MPQRGGAWFAKRPPGCVRPGQRPSGEQTEAAYERVRARLLSPRLATAQYRSPENVREELVGLHVNPVRLRVEVLAGCLRAAETALAATSIASGPPAVQPDHCPPRTATQDHPVARFVPGEPGEGKKGARSPAREPGHRGRPEQNHNRHSYRRRRLACGQVRLDPGEHRERRVRSASSSTTAIWLGRLQARGGQHRPPLRDRCQGHRQERMQPGPTEWAELDTAPWQG